MTDVFRFPIRPLARPGKNVHRATFFHVVGPVDRALTCAVFEVHTGLELRLSCGDQVWRSQLFQGTGRAQRVADTASIWRVALLQSGFVEQE